MLHGAAEQNESVETADANACVVDVVDQRAEIEIDPFASAHDAAQTLLATTRLVPADTDRELAHGCVAGVNERFGGSF